MPKQKRSMRNGLEIEINQKGLSLLEVLIASSLFFIFFTTFLSSQTDNILDSIAMEEELKLHNLAENTINDLLFSPPPLKETLLETLDFQKFEEEENANYVYAVELLPFEIPDSLMDRFTGGGEEEAQEPSPETQATKLLLKEFQKNLAKGLWQVRVTVKNVETNQEYFLASFLRNPKYKIKFNVPNFSGAAPAQGGGASGN